MEAIATPTISKTHCFDNFETPIIRKVVEDETPVLNRVLEPTSDFLMTQKNIKFNGNTSGLSEDMMPNDSSDSHNLENSNEGSPANFSKYSFNRTGGTGLDKSEVDEDFARLKIEGDTLKNSFENAGITHESLSKESLEPITGETLSRNSIPSGGFQFSKISKYTSYFFLAQFSCERDFHFLKSFVLAHFLNDTNFILAHFPSQ